MTMAFVSPRLHAKPGVAFVERKLSNSTVKDLVSISDADWHIACRSFNAVILTPRSRKALAIVQMDHTTMDIMVVDEVLRQSMGGPLITVAFDIATRVELSFALRLEPPLARSVGLALTMACLPKDQWLKDRDLDLSSQPVAFGSDLLSAKALHLSIKIMRFVLINSLSAPRASFINPR